MKDIRDIEGLEELTELKELHLDENHISEIKGIDHLTNLEVLNLGGNMIREIGGLNKLTRLKELYLGGNQINEIKSLDTLENLRILRLDINFEIFEIKGLEKLEKLEELNLEVNALTEIKGLDKLKNLIKLDLSNNQIKELKGLENLTNLMELNLFANRIEKIQGLENLHELRILYLEENRIEEIENLESLKKLIRLDLYGNKIKDIKGLDSLSNLQELSLHRNQISEIKGLENLENLINLGLSDNPIREIKNIENLHNLESFRLDSNLLTGLDEFIINSIKDAGKIVEYCQRKSTNRSLSLIDDYDESVGYEANIEKFIKEIEELDDDELLSFGTYEEDEILKEKQNLIFKYQPPDKLILNKTDSKKKKVLIHLIQLHSLKGIKPPVDRKIEYFNFFIKHFWDEVLIKKDKVLVYKDSEDIVNNKIKEMLKISSKFNPEKPNIIIFPENSIPKQIIEYLVEFTKINDVIIIGGLEHVYEEDRYINKAIIIERGKYYFQIKQTPVRIYDRMKKEYLLEPIKCIHIPKIRIFETSIGNIAIMICKDFLRLNEAVIDWAWQNEVDYIVIPSLTNKVLPFHAILQKMINITKYRKLKFIFNNIGEYGGSEFFSVDTNPNIEKRYRENTRDNLGEKIVIRNDIKKDIKEIKLFTGTYRMKLGYPYKVHEAKMSEFDKSIGNWFKIA